MSIGAWLRIVEKGDGESRSMIRSFAQAAGSLVYVLNELFHLGRRIATPPMFAWGVLGGFLTAYATDLILISSGS